MATAPNNACERYSGRMWRIAALVVALFIVVAVYEVLAGNWLSFR
jgi:hypothetical protein